MATVTGGVDEPAASRGVDETVPCPQVAVKAGGRFVRPADLAKTVRVEAQEPRDRGLRQRGRLASEASERHQSLHRVERRPVGARLVGKPSTPGRAAVLSAERGGTRACERGERDAEVGLGAADRPALIDPLEHEQRRIVGDGQDLGHGHDAWLTQPAQARGFGREEARDAAGCVLAKTRLPSERSIAKEAATSPPCTLDAPTTSMPSARSTWPRRSIRAPR